MSELVDEMRVYYARRAPVYDTSMGYDDPATVATDWLAHVPASRIREFFEGLHDRLDHRFGYHARAARQLSSYRRRIYFSLIV